MKPAADLRGRHDLGEIVGYAYRIYARNFVAFFALALIIMPVELLVGVLQARFSSENAQSYIQLLLFPALLLTLLASAALIFALHEYTGGTKPDASRALDAAFQRFGALFATILLAAGIGIASLAAVPFLTIWWLTHRGATVDGERNWWLVIVPGALTVYLSVRWAVAEQAVIIEGSDRWRALDASAAAVRGRWWRTLGVIAVVALIQLGPLLLASAAQAGPPIVAGGVSSAVAALVLPFAVISQTLLYYDLKARSDAHAGADRLSTSEPDVPGQGP